jgi:C4-dicarboxylate transporter DctQ subunit
MERLSKIYEAIEDWTAGLLLTGGLMLLFINVLGRYVFNFSFTWVEEVAVYMVIWGALIGASVALRDNHHIRVDMVYMLFPSSVQRIINIFANIVGLSFSAFVTYYGLFLVQKMMMTGQLSSGVGIPLWIVYMILPIFGFLLGARFITRLVRLLRGLPETDKEENPELASALKEGGVK